MADFSQQRDNFNQSPAGINASADLTDTKGESWWLEYAFSGLVWGFALATAGVLFWMSWIIFKDAYPAIEKFGLPFLWSTQWNIGELQFGALPFIYGTLVSSAIALLIAVPLGLSAAIVTSENFLPIWVRSPLGFLIELIAAIPSVIIGLWGIFVFIPFLLPFQQWLFDHFGWFPLFSTEPFGPGMLPAGIILSVMILPTIAAISREVLLAIPIDLRSASMSLGATRWETICYLLVPAGSSGIIGAIILALGRALGETMAVTMVIGNSIQINGSLLAPGYTIPAVLATQFREALELLHIGALMYLALILFLITLLVNFIAALLIQLIGIKAIKN
ncbi:phosphate ABC transporter permease subunit PstC [Kamptonema sp. UHCC 0994]|uniref:phosphate ABC transporter permease subunit PstC n=1 Tax=Kamptonema sp. UHCC 0994 TaxID=3031329 RepID=UPI0023B8D73D|nr:phosphate ABC transporter permease subunit PstC [Kamptonema sp. UHCC 0994]MDF0553167.1 phosphate ABC transporter permease subunit PstC [Kamptonema sp. UHCC 0994]